MILDLFIFSLRIHSFPYDRGIFEQYFIWKIWPNDSTTL